MYYSLSKILNRNYNIPKQNNALRIKGRLIVNDIQILERPEMTRGGKNVD